MRRLSSRAEGLVAINITALLFGTAALFGKLALSPLWIVGMRASFAALTLLVWVRAGPARRLAPVPKELWPAAISSGVILALHWLSFLAVVQVGGVAVATLTFASFPLFTVLLEARRRRRRPLLVELLAGATIILAVSLLVAPTRGHAIALAALVGLGSAACYAVFWHLSGALSVRLPAIAICFYQSVVVALVALPALPLVAHGPGEPIQWLLLAWFGVVNTALAPLLYLFALRRLSASTCSGFVALEPVYAIVLAAALFHDPISARIVLSGLLIVSASYVLLRIETAALELATAPSEQPQSDELRGEQL
jgi:drug/metabolite transporter (DMT)-like permease